jgi:hypothetical protein
MSTLSELKSILSILEDEYRERIAKLKECEGNINFLREKIYHTCVHQWVVDVSSSDDRTVFICSVCGLNKS